MTIHQLRKPCFTLDPSPCSDDDYGIPHYDTREKAAEALKELREEGLAYCSLPGVQVKQEDAPCWVAECDAFGCEEQYEDDEGGGGHFGSVAEVEEWMGPDGWTAGDPDKAYCPAHSTEGVPPPPSPAELEAAGQLRLIP